MRATNVILNLMSLALVAAGLGLLSTFFLPSVLLQSAASQDAGVAPPEDFNVPVLTEDPPTPQPEQTSGASEDGDKDKASDKKESPGKVKGDRKKQGQQNKQRASVPVPKDKTLWVTVPEMERVQSAPMPNTVGDDEASLKAYAGIHLKGTGFPWEDEANVYLAGHRLGYPNTNSFLAFWDLNKVKRGDEVYVTDAMGRSYTYRVFKELVVSPSDLFVTKRVKGKNIITLQTCTLPDYSQRLVVQAERVA
ncbi:hypothetical protein BH23ACT11_BH23ACT11_07390 [soil metagenome]